MLLTVAVESFLESKRLCDRSPRTLEHYRRWLSSFCDSAGPIDVESVTLSSLRAFASRLIDRGLGQSSRRGALIAVKVFLHWCIREGLIDADPAQRLEMPKRLKRHPNFLSTNDVLTLVNAVARHSRHAERDTALVCLLAESGLRRSEASALCWSDLHLAEHYAVVVGKGRKQRWVFFGEASEVALSSWLALTAGGENVFGLSIAGLRQFCRRLSLWSGLHVTPHLLRRSAATLRASLKMSAPALQDMFGWERIETANDYIAASQTRQQAAETNPLDGIILRVPCAIPASIE
jgi:site-specific recombinase XerD